MKKFLQFVIIVLFLLVTFFGIGPVLIADGSMQERLMTLVLVLLIYVVLIQVFRSISRR